MKTAVVASLSAISAVFLSISDPMTNGVVNQPAANALASVQFFWLVVMTIGLASVFWDFMLFAWQKEREISKKYDLPFNFLMSLMIGTTLIGVVLNLLNYMLLKYPTIFGQSFISMFFPVSVFVGGTFVLVLAEKKSAHIWRIFQIIIFSIVLGLFGGLAGLYLELGIWKYAHFFWLTRVVPGAIFGFFILLTIFSLYQKKPLFRAPAR